MDAVTLSENLISFEDHASVSGYAVSAMQWAVGQGLINGTDGKLRHRHRHPLSVRSHPEPLHRFAERKGINIHLSCLPAVWPGDNFSTVFLEKR